MTFALPGAPAPKPAVPDENEIEIQLPVFKVTAESFAAAGESLGLILAEGSLPNGERALNA